ncbi:MAG TPA: acyltransferase family protein [Candidatus Binatia bacterium]
MTASPATQRLASIDMVKGLAIIGVTFIHSTVLGQDSLWMTLLVVHSVPVFLVLFGMNSESWFRRHTGERRTLEWWERGVKRILIPAWATLAVWWVMVLVLKPAIVRVTPSLPLYHLIGYMKQVGMGWFVTVVLQLVLLFPLFHWLARRAGIAVVLALGLAATLVTLFYVQTIRGSLGLSGWMVLSPRFFAHVAFGMLLAPYAGRLGRRAVIAALVAYVVLALVQEKVLLAAWWRFANRLLELPLTVLLLAAMARLASVDVLRTSLSWLGQHSFGLYLGQLLTHNGFLFAFGGECTIFGCQGGVFERFDLWVYTGILAAGSLFFLALGHAALRLAESLRTNGVPLPDLST